VAIREIDEERAEKTLMLSLTKPGARVRLRDFIRTHFDAIAGSGKTIKAIHESMTKDGIDVGSYAVFGTTFSQIKRGRRKAESYPETSLDAAKPSPRGRERDTGEPAKSKNNPALPPVYLPDGTEVEITETGAKVFQIEHSPNWKGNVVREKLGERKGI
jgi:hypothetical protein